MNDNQEPYRNVCEVIVPAEMCCGCGLCAALCPVNALQISWNQYGEYEPVEVNQACITCSVCLTTCPFWDRNDDVEKLSKKVFENIPGIRYTSGAGYYLESFAGFVVDENIRVRRSSGGLTTWLLETCLRENMADYVVCVIANDDTTTRFRFAILDNVKEIHTAANSAYYPTEMSEVVREICRQPGRYVVVGIPCFLAGLRLAMQHDKKLRERIVVLVGLTCGQVKNKKFTEYLISNVGATPDEAIYIDFRHKDSRTPANDLVFRFTTRDNETSKQELHWRSIYGQAWKRGYFRLNACNYCDDVFAEAADVTFMDAWLPEYREDWRGTNLVIVRQPHIIKILKSGMDRSEISLDSIEIIKVLQSQAQVLHNKRDFLAYRLYLANRQNSPKYVPNRRVVPKRVPFIDRMLIVSQTQMAMLSRKHFAGDNRAFGSRNLRKFKFRIIPALLLYEMSLFLDRWGRRLPQRVKRKIGSLLLK